ncbi:TPA: phage protein Gp37 [Klebsiella pneumoniae]
MSIATTAEALIETVRQLCGRTVREVAQHPGQWSDEAVRQITRNPPAVYVAWLGFKPGSQRLTVTNRWALFVAARVINAKRGDPAGALDITELLARCLVNRRVGDSGVFTVLESRNLWDDTQATNGVAIYALYLAEESVLDPTDPGTELDDFLQHFQQWPAENENAPVWEADVRLPGPDK